VLLESLGYFPSVEGETKMRVELRGREDFDVVVGIGGSRLLIREGLD